MPPKKSTTQSTSTALQPKDANTSSTPQPKGATEEKTSKKRAHCKTTNEDSDAPSAKKQKKQSSDDTPLDLSDIKLPDEDTGRVPIFDTCDDVRKKITEHLHKVPNASQASFARELNSLAAHFPWPGIAQSEAKVDGRRLGDFLKKKGPQNGAHTMAFYAAYVYFEKLRIKEGKKKMKKREEMEKIWGEKGGFPRQGSHNVYITCFGSEKPKLDRFGQLQITGNPGTGGLRRKPLK